MDRSGSAPRLVRFGVFELDLGSGDLRKGTARLNLPDQPLQVLKALLERPGELVTRDELRLRLWPDDTFVDFEHGLNAPIKCSAIGSGTRRTRRGSIEPVPRRGYRFIAPVHRDEPESQSLPPSGHGTQGRRAVDPPPVS